MSNKKPKRLLIHVEDARGLTPRGAKVVALAQAYADLAMERADNGEWNGILSGNYEIADVLDDAQLILDAFVVCFRRPTIMLSDCEEHSPDDNNIYTILWDAHIDDHAMSESALTAFRNAIERQ